MDLLRHYSRLHERDIPRLVELLSPNAYKWREIGTQLGFTQHELNNIQCHPMTMVQGPVGYLTAMLSQWVEWTPQDGVHGKYASHLDLEEALKSQTVGLGNDAWVLRFKLESKVLNNGLKRLTENENKLCIIVMQRHIPGLVKVLSPYAYKWREIGTQLGFTQHELNNIEDHPEKPVGYLHTMLSQWVEWRPQDGVHGKYATYGDLRKALKSPAVNLGKTSSSIICSAIENIMMTTMEGESLKTVDRNVSGEKPKRRKMAPNKAYIKKLKSKLLGSHKGKSDHGEELHMDADRQEDTSDTENEDIESEESDEEYITCDETEEQEDEATTKPKGFFSTVKQLRRGIRKLYGAARNVTAGFVKGVIKTLNLDVVIIRKYKKRYDSYSDEEVTRWWFEIWGDEMALKEMEALWGGVSAEHKWRLETCPVVTP